MSQPSLFSWTPPPLPSPARGEAFDGRTYQSDRDYTRLTGQLLAVFELMKDGKFRTLSEIQETVEGSQTAISARLRDLRKEKYGAHQVDSEYVSRGLYRYRVIVSG